MNLPFGASLDSTSTRGAVSGAAVPRVEQCVLGGALLGSERPLLPDGICETSAVLGW